MFDIQAVRHPTEPSRFALAVLACGIAVGFVLYAALRAVGPLIVVVYGLGLVAFLGWIWLALQLWRMRLLGAAVRVSSDSFPELQAAVDEVRSRLNYTDRLDIHVVGKHNPPMELTSYFGTRVLILEGGAVADLTAPSSRSQLIFILSTFVGALKAKHARWTPAFIALEVLGLTGVLTPFINPWHRATVYSGDQIAYVSCADLKVSIEAVHRVLVGREIVPQLHAEGIIGSVLHR